MKDKHTIEELKQKLIDLTLEYTNLKSYDNKEARELKYNIDCVTKAIYWHGVTKEAKVYISDINGNNEKYLGKFEPLELNDNVYEL